MLVDSHCHITYPDFTDDFAQVLTRAKENDVRIMQTISTQISEFDKLLKLTEAHEEIYCSVGNHPCDIAKEGVISEADLLEYTKYKKVIGIGETGLDYYHPGALKDHQIESFINHIKVARKTNLPTIIHSRDAEDDTYNILKDEMAKGKFKALIHCFTGSKEFCDKLLELGCYISISGIVTFKNAIDLQDIVRDLPLERMLIETDAPYLAPMPNRGKRNEPAFVKNTAEFIADLKGIGFEQIAKITTKNFLELFDRVRLTF